jgi:hypothetical protein
MGSPWSAQRDRRGASRFPCRLRHDRKLIPVLRQARGACHRGFVQHQYHERLDRNVSFGRHSSRAGPPEAEARVIRGVPKHDDERAAVLPQALNSRLHEPAADPLALVLRKHGHSAEGRSGNLPHASGAVEKVTRHAIVRGRDQ